MLLTLALLYYHTDVMR